MTKNLDAVGNLTAGMLPALMDTRLPGADRFLDDVLGAASMDEVMDDINGGGDGDPAQFSCSKVA